MVGLVQVWGVPGSRHALSEYSVKAYVLYMVGKLMTHKRRAAIERDSSTRPSSHITCAVLCFLGAALQPVTAHTTPLLLGAMRLLPAGLALVGWAVATGRPQPKTSIAWAWIVAFALVDGAAFQVRLTVLDAGRPVHGSGAV